MIVWNKTEILYTSLEMTKQASENTNDKQCSENCKKKHQIWSCVSWQIQKKLDTHAEGKWDKQSI